MMDSDNFFTIHSFLLIWLHYDSWLADMIAEVSISWQSRVPMLSSKEHRLQKIAINMVQTPYFCHYERKHIIFSLTSKHSLTSLCMNPTFQCCSNFALNFFILCHEIVLRLNLWWAWRLFRRMGISTFADGGRPPDRSRAIVSLWVIDTISKWLRPIYVSTDQCWQTCCTCVHCSYHCIVWCDVFNPSQRWWSLTT